MRSPPNSTHPIGMRSVRIAILLLLAAAPARAYDEESARQYMAVRKQIAALVNEPNLGPEHLARIERMAREFRRKWRNSEVKLYALTTLQLSRKMGGHNFQDQRQEGVRQRLAMDVLEKAHVISLEIECDAAMQLQAWVDDNGKKLRGTDAWPAARRRMATHWLHAWGRLQRTIDPDWDPDYSPCAYPDFDEVDLGTDPDSIKDPDLRKRYEKAIAEHRRELRLHRTQRGARKLARWFPKQAERFLKGAYITAPRDDEELANLLADYLPDAAARKRVLDAVRDPDAEFRKKISDWFLYGR